MLWYLMLMDMADDIEDRKESGIGSIIWLVLGIPFVIIIGVGLWVLSYEVIEIFMINTAFPFIADSSLMFLYFSFWAALIGLYYPELIASYLIGSSDSVVIVGSFIFTIFLSLFMIHLLARYASTHKLHYSNMVKVPFYILLVNMLILNGRLIYFIFTGQFISIENYFSWFF